MTLIVCPLHEVDKAVSRHRPARVVSLLSPDQAAPELPAGTEQRVLRFHDIAEPRPGLIAPDTAMVAELIGFGRAWGEPGPLLLHCWMGISRSTAAALILACALNPDRNEAEAAFDLRAAAPFATPNPLMISIADDLLGRSGRLVGAAQAMGRGAEAWTGATFTLPVRRAS